jgi:integrase
MASVRKLPDGRWQARYRVAPGGRQYSRTTRRKTDAQDWLDEQTSRIRTGTWTDPKTARTTVGEWCDTWLAGYGTRRGSTVRQAEIHIKVIKAQFGGMRLGSVKPSDVRSWTTKLQAEGREPSYVYALHARLAQVMSDAVHDGILAKSPCSRRTSPPAAAQRPYVATTDQVWALHDAMPEHLRAAILLGAFAGLRVGEACGLRVSDVDFMRGVVTPAVQYPAEPLKNEYSKWPVPIPKSLALELSAHVAARPARVGVDTILTDMWGQQLAPWTLERAIRDARVKVDGLPDGFRFHDLRHYFASLLIADGADIKTVQTRMRHGSATTTLRTYTHLWPDKDESTRATVDAVIAARVARTEELLRNGEVVN